MTHILKADKEHYRFFDIRDLARDDLIKVKNNVPVRILGRVFCFLTREGMYRISQIAREEKLVSRFTLKLDPQMDNDYIREDDAIGQHLKLSLITFDGHYLFMDCSELHKDLNLTTKKQWFFSGNILIIEHEIACLKLSCITSADGLDIALYNKTRLLMNHVLKPKPLEAASITPPAAKPEAMDVEEIDNTGHQVESVQVEDEGKQSKPDGVIEV